MTTGVTNNTTNTTANSTTNSSSSTASNAANSSLDQLAGNFNSFLTLLTTQLQNQDPLDPLDTNQFTQQLVEFASVQQQVDMNSNMQTLISLQQTSEATSAMQMIGSNVTLNASSLGSDVERACVLESEFCRTGDRPGHDHQFERHRSSTPDPPRSMPAATPIPGTAPAIPARPGQPASTRSRSPQRAPPARRSRSPRRSREPSPAST